MENPLNPLESQGPLENQNPLGDPLLDALERSIENPPGFTDPLAGPDEPFVDDLARQLDQVEANVEKTPAISRNPGIIPEGVDPETQDSGSIDSEAPASSDISEDPGTTEEMWGTFQSTPPLPQEGSAHMPLPNPPLRKPPRKGGGNIRPRQKLPRHFIVSPRRRIFGTSSNLRFCPESREAVNTEECQKCEKYRHWPEGTDEEPRECWYDWQAKQSLGESDDSEAER